ncbi:MAG: GNAT family N-acetyltransferase [Massilibacteroides sp.]|nr:GNAT family N-acetyltransferase [Massilibacteroides sp.]MDD3063983.1 GNAT family N-acetyltransferase [Massilibacteroides sp.]MDD4115558.1 GNAT family N-acetyltransferase [Massilibacteroides sp.]MDD4661452.1 GNAT family N-acetyltransferase [Massilibacteroides sp.]
MIETDRLLIKPLTAEELKQAVNSPENFAKGLRLIPSHSLIDKETKKAIVNDLLPNIDNPSKDYIFYTMWLIIWKEKRAIVGGICFHGEPDENGEVEIGYGTDIKYHNNGFMTEAIAGVIHWIQKNKNVNSIVAETDQSNFSSIKVLENNNFKKIRSVGASLFLKIELK